MQPCLELKEIQVAPFPLHTVMHRLLDRAAMRAGQARRVALKLDVDAAPIGIQLRRREPARVCPASQVPH